MHNIGNIRFLFFPRGECELVTAISYKFGTFDIIALHFLVDCAAKSEYNMIR